MTPMQIRNSMVTLAHQGTSLREISRLVHLSRNTVRRVLREPADAGVPSSAMDWALQDQLAQAYARAGQRRAHGPDPGRRARFAPALQHAHALGAPDRAACAAQTSGRISL